LIRYTLQKGGQYKLQIAKARKMHSSDNYCYSETTKQVIFWDQPILVIKNEL